jgi:hypothetical protein
MLKFTTVAAVSALALTALSLPASAHDGGAIAAGVIGGLAVGAIVGSQANRGYYGPGYGQAYYGDQTYQPVYSNCHIEREQVVDQYGRYHSRRIRVCD